jgi:hypothetical protein
MPVFGIDDLQAVVLGMIKWLHVETIPATVNSGVKDQKWERQIPGCLKCCTATQYPSPK